MISHHCGQRLWYRGRAGTASQTLYHRWKCSVCGRSFKQRVRRPA